MPPASSSDITADSYSFRQTSQARLRRKPKTTSSQTRKTTATVRRRNETVPGGTSGPDVTDSTHQSGILGGIVVFIDKSLWEEQRIARLAINMGANVADGVNKSVTHIVHGPGTKGRIPRLVNQALERNIRVVSPAWVERCFELQKRLPELYFPYDTDSKDGLRRFSVDDFESNRRVIDDNPFNLAPEEIESSTDDDGDAVAEDSDAPIDMEHSQTTSTTTVNESEKGKESNTPLQPETTNDEARRLRREKRSAEIAKILQAVKETRNRELNRRTEREGEENEPPMFSEPKLGGDLVLPEEEHLEIWYGNQSFHYDSQHRTKRTTTTTTITTAAAANTTATSPRRSSRVAATNATKRLKRK